MGLFEQDIRENIAAAKGDGLIPAIHPAGVQTRNRSEMGMLQNTPRNQYGEVTSPLQPHGGQYADFAQQHDVYGSGRKDASEETAQKPPELATTQTVLRELAKAMRRTDRLLVTE